MGQRENKEKYEGNPGPLGHLITHGQSLLCPCGHGQILLSLSFQLEPVSFTGYNVLDCVILYDLICISGLNL